MKRKRGTNQNLTAESNPFGNILELIKAVKEENVRLKTTVIPVKRTAKRKYFGKYSGGWYIM